MLGNRDWTRLKHERFPEYQQALIELAETGVAVADVTRAWTRMLDLKADHDLTGNGVNHPNDFGIESMRKSLPMLGAIGTSFYK